jgi:signal transduction histidine kinase/DNA-binding NarL/FixJ family response regulator
VSRGRLAPAIYLEAEEAEHQKELRLRRIHVRVVPAVRVAGFAVLLGLVALHQRFINGAFSWGELLRVSAILEGYALAAWLALAVFYGGPRTRHLPLVFLFADILLATYVIYVTGGDRSWLFVILAFRPADIPIQLSRKQVLAFVHACVGSYVALLLYLVGVEGRDIVWAAALVKAAILYFANGYLALVFRTGEGLRQHTADAVRLARSLIPQLEEAKKAAEAANRTKSEFLARITHELRTPLNGIIVTAHLMRSTELTPEQRRYMATADASAAALMGTIDDVLSFSKIEAGKLVLERTAFGLRAALAMSMATLASEAQRKGLELTSVVAPDVPDRLVGDPIHLRQVLLNLGGNAIKFTDHGRVHLDVTLGRVTDDLIEIQFSVADTGIGIAADKQDTIFEPFAQADDFTTRKYGGTGLGLAISAQLVRLMDGRLWVESTLGQGSRFTFTAQFGHGGAEADNWPPPPEQPALQSAHPRQILLVEDHPVNQEVAIRLLEAWGHAVTTAESGQDALAALAARDFDLVLMDVQMAGMDGLQATAEIRRREQGRGSRTPIVALTAHGTAADRERCLAAGMDDFVSKPLDARVLFRAIEQFVPTPSSSTLPSVGEISRPDPALERRLADLFAEHAPRLLAAVRDALDRADAGGAAVAAHTLKGAVGNLPAPAAFGAAERLETLAHDGNLEEARMAHAVAEREIAKLLTMLRASP